MKATNSNRNSNAAATGAKLNLAVALSLAAIVASVFVANSSSAGGFEAAIPTATVQRPAASIQLADPSDEEVNQAMYPEQYFKQLNCGTDTECEKARATLLIFLPTEIAKMQLLRNRTEALTAKINKRLQELKDALKKVQ